MTDHGGIPAGLEAGLAAAIPLVTKRLQQAIADGAMEEAGMTNRVTDQLLTPSEVAAMFRVDPKTVTRWARAGKLTAIRTLGGHRRFRTSEIQRLLDASEVEA